jgi:hypothetical protein
MKAVATFLAAVSLAARHLWNHRLLMLCLLIGLTVAVGLLSSIPLYADAVNNRLLQGELTEQGRRLPPFAFVWRYIGMKCVVVYLPLSLRCDIDAIDFNFVDGCGIGSHRSDFAADNTHDGFRCSSCDDDLVCHQRALVAATFN